MGFYLPGNFLGEIIMLIPIAIKITIAILAVIFLIKGIKHYNNKNNDKSDTRR